MKNLKIFLVAVILACLSGFGADAAGQSVMSVQVKKGQLRAIPSFLGKIVTVVYYGERVAVNAEKGGWYQVAVPGSKTTGWIHASALTRKRIEIKAGASNVSAAADSDELALAGKGFNKQVEGEFRSKNPHVDFTWVDKMEAMEVSQNEIQAFLEEGELLNQGGAHE